LGHKKIDPHQKLESLERWSARATLAILLGIFIEIGSLFWFQHDPVERLIGVIANALIGIGLVVEYIAILRAIVASGDANRESDEKIAEANERAAQADLARAELEDKLRPRELNQAQWDFIQELTGQFEQVNIGYETDAETRWYAMEVQKAFFAAGIRVALYPRAADVHSFGTLIYEPQGFDGAQPRTVAPLVEIFRRGDIPPERVSLAVITSPPTDMTAPSEFPMIILGGRFLVAPAWSPPRSTKTKTAE
jgi:hypothetical protein